MGFLCNRTYQASFGCTIPAPKGGPTGRKISAWTKNGSAHKTTFVSARPVPKPRLFKSFPPVDGPEEKLNSIGPEEKQSYVSDT
jgi:hypothetical protein